METPLEILKKYWDYDQFISPQEEIITAVLKGEIAIPKPIELQVEKIVQEVRANISF